MMIVLPNKHYKGHHGVQIEGDQKTPAEEISGKK